MDERMFDLYQHLESVPQLRLLRDEPMLYHTTFRTGGPAAIFVRPKLSIALESVLRLARNRDIEPVIIGAGSNTLVPDEGLDTLVIQLQDMDQICVEGHNIVAESGVSLRRLATAAMEHSITGLEFAYGIPGTLGGAVYMNAGAYGGQMSDVVSDADVLRPDGTTERLTREQLGFSYRHSSLMDAPGIILRVFLTLSYDLGPAPIKQRMDQLQQRRRASQPLNYPSAGSTFKRPAGGYAAALIEEAGLKGLTLGGAQVSEKHTGFIINTGCATTADILALIALVQKRVYDHSGIQLEPEVRILPHYKEGKPCNF